LEAITKGHARKNGENPTTSSSRLATQMVQLNQRVYYWTPLLKHESLSPDEGVNLSDAGEKISRLRGE
jgi:hypothetical protein